MVAIAAGHYHSLALKADGTVIAWGTYIQSIAPGGWRQMYIPSGLSNVVAIAASALNCLALRNDSTLVRWGTLFSAGSSGELSGLSNVVGIADSGLYEFALQSNTTAFAWYAGVNLQAIMTNVVAISGGANTSVGIKTDGTVAALSGSAIGTPANLSNVISIAAGGNHALAITLAPALTLVPPATISLHSGANTSLSVEVMSGSSFGTQWLFNGNLLSSGLEMAITVTNFDLTKAGSYSVVVTNQYGNASATTVLRLTSSPVIFVNGVDVGGGKVDRVDSAQIVMTNTGSGAAIYFTLDGSAPDFTDIPYTGPFTLTNSATIRAIAYNFAFTDFAEAAPITVQVWPTYPLSATTPGGGSLGHSPTPYSAGNRYVSNTVVTLTATPVGNWSFLGWTGDSSATSNVTSVLMDRARTVTGVFGTALNLFTNGSGQVQLNPPTGPYAFGSTVQLTALPAPGYYFFGWANAANGFGNPLTFPVTNASGITANFGALAGNQVSLVVLPNGNGSVSVNPAKNVYTNGESVTLTAWPAANQTFTGWSGDAAGNLNPLVLALTNSTLITANFAPGSPTNPPVITQPPLSRTLSAGADTLLSFALTGGGPFSYQWRFGSATLNGATNPTLALNGLTAAQAGLYDIVVTGAGGAVTSSPASVAIFGMQLIPSGGSPLPLLILDGGIGTRYRLETSPSVSLSNWSLLTPVTLPSSRFYYADTTSSNQPARFYRAVPQ